jgi:hypothetical protein
MNFTSSTGPILYLPKLSVLAVKTLESTSLVALINTPSRAGVTLPSIIVPFLAIKVIFGKHYPFRVRSIYPGSKYISELLVSILGPTLM